MQQQHSPHPGGQMMHASMPPQIMRQAMPPGSNGHQQQMQIQPHLGHHSQQMPRQQHQHQHQKYHQIQGPHSHGPSPVSLSGSPQLQLQQHPSQHQSGSQTHQQSGLPQQHHMHPQSPHSHNGPPMHMQQQQQQQQPQINQMIRSSLGPSVLNHQQPGLHQQQLSHHHQNFFNDGAITHSNPHHYPQRDLHQAQQQQPTQHHQNLFGDNAIAHSNPNQYPQRDQHQPHHQHQHQPHHQIQTQPQTQIHHNHSQPHPHPQHQLQHQHQHQHQNQNQNQNQNQHQQQQHQHQHQQQQQQQQQSQQHHLHQPKLIHHTPPPTTHHQRVQQNIEKISPCSPISQTEYRIIELNRWLQSRPISRNHISPQPNSYLFDETRWWEKFACEFFEDDATLTLRIQDDKLAEYTIGRTLIPRFFRTYFDGGVSDLSFNLRSPKEYMHSHPTSLITLDCDQAFIVSIFRFPPGATNPGVVVHTEGHLIVDFVSNTYDSLSIKSWKFFTKNCREYIDRSITAMGSNLYLAEPITRQGLTKSTISYLKMCMIMEPMQELMLQNRQTRMDPRSCLRKYLYDRFKFSSATITDNRAGVTKNRRKRKSPAAPLTTGPTTQTATKKTKANSNNPIGIKSGLSNNSLTMSSPVIPSFSLASQDVMVVGEPSMMGCDFSDDNERMITRLEDAQYDQTTSTPVTEESNGVGPFTGNENSTNSLNHIDQTLENHNVSPSLLLQRQQPQQHRPALSASSCSNVSEQHQVDRTSPHVMDSQQQTKLSLQETQSEEKPTITEHSNQVDQQDLAQPQNETIDQQQQTATEPKGQKDQEQLETQESVTRVDDAPKHQNDSSHERESTRDSIKSVDTKVDESVEIQVAERKNGVESTKPKDSVNEASNESTASTKISSKQNRRRSSERKETLREGLMRTSDFVVAMKDLKSEHPALWRITTGNNLLQQFAPKPQKGMILYENTHQYAGWNPEIKKDYVGVDVKLTQQNRNQIFVERLFLNFQKIEDAEAFYDKHFVIYLQIIISTALDPKFWDSIESEPEHHDYFITSRRIIEDIIKRHKVKLSTKLKLNESVIKQIEKYPIVVVTELPNDNKEQLCRACNTNPSTQNLSFANRSYDLHSYKLVQVTGESTEESELNHNLCDACLELVKLYSSVHHLGWKLYNLAKEKIKQHRTDGKPINAILDECLKDESWLTSTYQNCAPWIISNT